MRDSRKHPIAWLAAAWLAAVVSLPGCGQKGPLYFPDEEDNKEKKAALEPYPRFSDHGLL